MLQGGWRRHLQCTAAIRVLPAGKAVTPSASGNTRAAESGAQIFKISMFDALIRSVSRPYPTRSG
jgi:hypothetical protein